MLLAARTTRALIVGVVASIAVIATALAPPAATATPSSSLRRYPYLTDLVKQAVRVNWATTTSITTGSVAYGISGQESCTAHTVTASKTSITVGSTAEYQWVAPITALKRDTAYCYRIFGGGADLLGTDASPVFRSQPRPVSSASYSFAVIGDWGAQDTSAINTDQANLLSEVASSGALFAVGTGDVGYPSGSQTNYGDLQQTGASVSAVFGPSYWTVAGASIPMFHVLGNHGLNSTALVNWPEARAASTSGGRYKMETYCCTNGTSSASYPSAWYAFDAGLARFYILDASWANSNVGSADLYKNDYDNHWTSTSSEYQWLQNDLQAHPGGIKLAFFHFPLHSANSTESSDTYLSGAGHLEGLLAQYGVDIVFNGHAHTYSRATPSEMPVNYVTGGGGADLEPATVCGAPIAAAIGWSYSSSTHGSSCGSVPRPTSIDQVFHFLLVTVNGSTVTVAPTDERGRTFDVQTYHFS
jgi:Calcineurin-like phosphoesterase/Purple acid Phosphatase, N-terminal domain